MRRLTCEDGNVIDCLSALKHRWKQLLHNMGEMQVDSIYFDFSKAFDTVIHDRLLQTVWNAGVRKTLFLWLKSYVSVRTCGAESYSFYPSFGVP